MAIADHPKITDQGTPHPSPNGDPQLKSDPPNRRSSVRPAMTDNRFFFFQFSIFFFSVVFDIFLGRLGKKIPIKSESAKFFSCLPTPKQPFRDNQNVRLSIPSHHGGLTTLFDHSQEGVFPLLSCDLVWGKGGATAGLFVCLTRVSPKVCGIVSASPAAPSLWFPALPGPVIGVAR